jgi:hypothetical protein
MSRANSRRSRSPCVLMERWLPTDAHLLVEDPFL